MKNVLVTLADERYIDQAKQLFSSAYWNAGWKGDYMLLAHEIPEQKLKWFTDKGILVKKCKPLYKEKFGFMPGVVTSKFYLFTPEFKKWNTVIYLDADIIVRASLDKLTKEKGFSAGIEVTSMKLRQHFAKGKYNPIETINKLEEKYDLTSIAFNSGVMIFDTKIIDENSFDTLIKLSKEYDGANGDQRVFNLFFYKRWKKLPCVYNFLEFDDRNQARIEPKNVKAIIIHFISGPKPWVSKKYFYNEWKYNLDKAEEINLERIPSGKKWSNIKILLISWYIDLRKFRYTTFVRKYPRVFNLMKRLTIIK